MMDRFIKYGNNKIASEKKISKNGDIINDAIEDEIIHNLEMNKNNIIIEKDNNIKNSFNNKIYF